MASIGANLFYAQLRDTGLYGDVAGALDASRLSPTMLESEITETTVLGLEQATIETLRRLRTLNASLGLDDIAESIETLDRATALVSCGCKEAQIYNDVNLCR